MPSPESIELSRAFYTDPNSYGPFSSTADHKLIIACIEPRDQDGLKIGQYKTVVQTSGGAIGEGQDAALALTVVTNELVTVDEGMEYDARKRVLTVFGGHHDCAFESAQTDIMGELASPTEPTLEAADRWSKYFNEADVFASALPRITEAAKGQLEHMQDNERSGSLVENADRLFPGHKNVVHVRGQNNSRLWVTNLHPHVGKDRNKKPADSEQANKIQGYHDSLAATVSDLGEAYGLPRDVRGLRFAAMLMRAAATRTVITTPHLSEFTLLEVRPADTQSGLEIVEEQAA